MAVIGLGVDIVDVARFAAALERTPALGSRILTKDELAVARPERLAARFAAKEAVAKALGAPRGLEWHDVQVVTAPDGSPSLQVSGTVAAAAAARGICTWHLSMSHDGGFAIATVIAES